jgi:hypothetical protein
MAARGQVLAVVLGLSALLGAGAVVASVAERGPSSATRLTALTPSVASTTLQDRSVPRARTIGVSDQTAGSNVAVARAPVTTAPAPSPKPAAPHFDTPQAAMTYLAAAWNAHDEVALGHVTNPGARTTLDAMHSEAVNLRLDHCDRRPQGDYLCYFHHDYPSGTSAGAAGGGQAAFLVAPALTPGWYMTVVQSCG